MLESKTFEVKRENLAEIQDFVSTWAEKVDVPMKFATKIDICTDEIVSNVVFYSGANSLEMICNREGSEVTISFIDDGKAFNPLTESKEPDITASAEEREIGGLGIFMVKKMMSEVTYERSENKNKLTMKMAI